MGGIPIADAAGYKPAQLAAIKPGDRFRATSPVIAMRAGRPALALAGMSLFPETVQRLLIGIVGNRLEAQAAMAAPPLLTNFDFGKTAQLVPKGVMIRIF